MKIKLLSLLICLSLPLIGMYDPQGQIPSQPKSTFWQKHKKPLVYTGTATLIAGYYLYQAYKNYKNSQNSGDQDSKPPQSMWAKTKYYTLKGCTYLANFINDLVNAFEGDAQPSSTKPKSSCHKFDEDLCAICFASLGDLVIELDVTFLQTPCKHIFHHNCLDDWLKKSHSCPLCRKEISEPCTPLICAYCHSKTSIVSNPFCIYEPCSNENCNMLGLVFHKNCFTPVGTESNPQCPSCKNPRKMKLFATGLD